ncbi:phytochrome-like protein cph1 [Tritonibacter horizontis]|uniref:histidine kinase n=2 Tax=Tritonibacter horizontis TaxID=1768241 RepID=A0A132BW11_9RHOB|nr:phytochrome-like protein cph1 [Tritonibacter horizontis]
MTRHFNLTFRGKLIALCLTVVILSVSAMLAISFRQLETFGQQAANHRLAMEAELNSRLIAKPFQRMLHDAQALAMTPPFERMRQGAAEDPPASMPTPKTAAPPDTASPQTPLAEQMLSLLKANPHYDQVSVIDLVGQAGTRTQVQHFGAAMRSETPERHRWEQSDPAFALLERGPAFYFARPAPGDDTDKDVPIRRALNVVQPLLDISGNVIAAIVITANYRRLLLTAAPMPSTGHQLRVVNANGDFLIFQDDGTPSRLFQSTATNLKPFVGHHWTPDPNGPLKFESETTAYFHEVAIPDHASPFRIVVATSAPHNVLHAASNDALNNNLAVTGLLIAATLVLTWSVSHVFTAPLAHLVASIRELPNTENAIALPAETQDEIGQLSRAFVDLTNDLITRSSQMVAIFECAVDGILTVRPDGVILNANPAATEMFGYTPDALIGQHLDLLIPQEFRGHHAGYLATNNFDSLRRQMAPNRDVHGLRRDGSLFDVEVSISQVLADSGNAFIAIMRDVSSRKAAENRLEQTVTDLEAAKAELERSNIELDTFAYVASHDLKAPLRVIRNAATWLEQDLAEHLTEDTRESMDLLQSRVERMEQLLTDLLAHSRIGKEEQDQVVISGQELLEQIFDLISIPDSFSISYDDALAQAQLAAMPLRNVLLNLVSNAIKHHDRQDGHVHIGFAEDEDMFIFSITDDGPGIAPKYHQKIFQMFQTLRPRDEVEGSGMGLAMVEKTVSTVGGQIALTSAPGEGSCFRVTWPRPVAMPQQNTDQVA